VTNHAIKHATKPKLVNKNVTNLAISHAINHVIKLKLANKNVTNLVTSHAINHATKHKLAKHKKQHVNTNINMVNVTINMVQQINFKAKTFFILNSL
jgi:hypothetical protein